MKTFVIAGGTSGIGLEAARQLLVAGHRVILLGRNEAKGRAAVQALNTSPDRAQFCQVDLSTNDGVRAAAPRIAGLADTIDGLLHSAAEFVTGDTRTADGLPLFAALGYIGRYHLTQLLLPQLLKAEHPRVMMFTAGLRKVPKIDMTQFPTFPKFNFFRGVMPINGACMVYAHYLTKQHPKLLAGTVCPGAVKTNLFDNAPWYLRAMSAVSHIFGATSLEEAPRNAVQALLTAEGDTALNWPLPSSSQSYPIVVDPAVEAAVIAVSRKVTGA